MLHHHWLRLVPTVGLGGIILLIVGFIIILAHPHVRAVVFSVLGIGLIFGLLWAVAATRTVVSEAAMEAAARSTVKPTAEAPPGDSVKVRPSVSSATVSDAPQGLLTEWKDATHSTIRLALRPDWTQLDASPQTVNDAVRITVSSGPFATVAECQRDVQTKMREAVRDYLDQDLLEMGASRLVPLSNSYLENLRIAQFHEEPTFASVGKMHQLHALLELTPQTKAVLIEAWHHGQVNERLFYLGGGLALVLGFLATVWGYLKLDTATHSRYSGRLGLAASILIVLLIAGAELLRRGALIETLLAGKF